MVSAKQRYTEEYSLRLKFEEKINKILAFERELNAKYERALEDIHTLQTDKAKID